MENITLAELVKLYETDCDSECDKCPLGTRAIKRTSDLPELPEGLDLCALFDYINQNSPAKPGKT